MVMSSPPEAPAKIQRPGPVILVTLLRCPPSKFVKQIRRAGRRRLWRTVFLTSSGEVSEMIASSVSFEHLPDPDLLVRSVGAEAAEDYLRLRYRTVLGKWKPLFVFHKGLSVEEYFGLCKNHVMINS
jgi:hypothetical protein